MTKLVVLRTQAEMDAEQAKRDIERQLRLAVSRRRLAQIEQGDDFWRRRFKADKLKTQRVLRRYNWVYNLVLFGPLVLFCALFLKFKLERYYGINPASSITAPAKPVKHVPAKLIEPEPTLEADEPLDYQGLELS